jgi:hypothetical protein
VAGELGEICDAARAISFFGAALLQIGAPHQAVDSRTFISACVRNQGTFRVWFAGGVLDADQSATVFHPLLHLERPFETRGGKNIRRVSPISPQVLLCGDPRHMIQNAMGPRGICPSTQIP